jgi:hypothetical protein
LNILAKLIITLKIGIKSADINKKADDFDENISEKVEHFIYDINSSTNQKSHKNNHSENSITTIQ